MTRRSIVLSAVAFLLLLACSEGTGPGGPPAIVFMSFGSTTSPYGPDPEIFVMDSLGRHPVDVTRHVGADVDPAWSPDGAKIIFSRRDSTGAGHLFLMNPDGSDLTQLTSGTNSEWGPAWSRRREDRFHQEQPAVCHECGRHRHHAVSHRCLLR